MAEPCHLKRLQNPPPRLLLPKSQGLFDSKSFLANFIAIGGSFFCIGNGDRPRILSERAQSEEQTSHGEVSTKD